MKNHTPSLFMVQLAVFGPFIAAAMLVSVIIGMICWPYSLNSWLEFGGKTPTVTWWQGGLLGLVPVVGQMSLPTAAVTFIMMLILT